MNVAIVYHFFPHYRAAVMRELLGSTEHHYVLVADERSTEPTINAWPIEDRSRFISAPCKTLFGRLLLQRGLLRLALDRRLDSVIYLGNPYFLSTWISALLARLTGKQVLFWTHGWTRDERGPKAWFRRLFYKLPHALLLYGHAAKMAGLARGLPREALHVIYNSLDYEEQKRIRAAITQADLIAVRRERFANPNLPLIVCSARLTRACRFDLLLEAQARLRDDGHPVNVLLIGDGAERSALEEQAAAAKLPVHFEGACYDEPRLARLITAADLTVSPGKIGLTAMHSLAYGTPVITHDDFESQGPEWEAILPGRTGDFFARGDVTELMHAIRQWTCGDKSRPEITTVCQNIVERFYNPGFQRRAIDRAVSGCQADDLFWIREPLPST